MRKAIRNWLKRYRMELPSLTERQIKDSLRPQLHMVRRYYPSKPPKGKA